MCRLLLAVIVMHVTQVDPPIIATEVLDAPGVRRSSSVGRFANE